MRTCPECNGTFKPKRKEQLFCGRSCANTDRARRREKAKENLRQYSVWSCGGGVQSTAIAVLIIQGKLPKPDFAITTDCGYEHSHTLDHVHNRLVPELKKVGVKLHVIKTNDYTDNSLFEEGGLLSIPAYAKRKGKVIKYRTYCNNRFKVRPSMMWIREQGIKRCENWIGVSTDEARRARPSNKKWITFRYPLLELDMDRDACAWIIGQHGWPRPERSSCIMCPQQTEMQWERMQEHCPEDYRRAIEIEKQIHERCPDVFLRRTMQPLSRPQV